MLTILHADFASFSCLVLATLLPLDVYIQRAMRVVWFTRNGNSIMRAPLAVARTFVLRNDSDFSRALLSFTSADVQRHRRTRTRGLLSIYLPHGSWKITLQKERTTLNPGTPPIFDKCTSHAPHHSYWHMAAQRTFNMLGISGARGGWGWGQGAACVHVVGRKPDSRTSVKGVNMSDIACVGKSLSWPPWNSPIGQSVHNSVA